MSDDIQTDMLDGPADNGVWIRGLKVENFAGLKEMDLDLGALTVLVGANASGKTSLLEAIKAALSRGGFDDDSINIDADKGEVQVNLSNGMEVKARRVRGKNPTVKVSQDGVPMPSPRTLLDGLLDPVSLDPMKWLDGDRTQALLDAMPLRVSKADIQAIYDEAGVPEAYRKGQLDGMLSKRHAVEVIGEVEKHLVGVRRNANAEVKQLAAWVAQEQDNLADLTDPTDMIDKLQETAREAQRQIDAAGHQREAHEAATEAVQRAEERLAAKQERIEDMEQQLAIAREEAAMLATDLEDARHKLKETPEPAEDLSEVEAEAARVAAELADLKEQRGRYLEAREQQGRVDSEAERLEKMREVAKSLDAGVKAFRAAPGGLLAGADLPVDGLEYTDGKLTRNGVPIGKLSGAETVRLACKVAVHRVKQQRGQFVLLDGLEQLDDEQRAAMLEEVRASGVQWIITEVGQRGDVADGTVVVMGGAK